MEKVILEAEKKPDILKNIIRNKYFNSWLNFEQTTMWK